MTQKGRFLFVVQNLGVIYCHPMHVGRNGLSTFLKLQTWRALGHLARVFFDWLRGLNLVKTKSVLIQSILYLTSREKNCPRVFLGTSDFLRTFMTHMRVVTSYRTRSTILFPNNYQIRLFGFSRRLFLNERRLKIPNKHSFTCACPH